MFNNASKYTNKPAQVLTTTCNKLRQRHNPECKAGRLLSNNNNTVSHQAGKGASKSYGHELNFCLRLNTPNLASAYSTRAQRARVLRRFSNIIHSIASLLFFILFRPFPFVHHTLYSTCTNNACITRRVRLVLFGYGHYYTLPFLSIYW